MYWFCLGNHYPSWFSPQRRFSLKVKYLHISQSSLMVPQRLRLCLGIASVVVLISIISHWKAKHGFVCVFSPSGSSRRRWSTRNSHNAKPRRYIRSALPQPIACHSQTHNISLISTAGNNSRLSRKKDLQRFTDTLFSTHSHCHHKVTLPAYFFRENGKWDITPLFSFPLASVCEHCLFCILSQKP